MSTDLAYMAHALQLAARGHFSTSPNPRVGCVLVKNGVTIGEGWHIAAGGPHAEIHALQQAGAAASGATAFVTLEPCSHHGKTGPCCDALIQAGITRVVYGMQDPNPQVAGNGLQTLRDAGVTVDGPLLEQSGTGIEYLASSNACKPACHLCA
jgi:diaminohydroxyphosphoribosylaminopyrimidine deaminase/5-amino-6-(5-phosphoribosylamino)uracil reductase